nr:hypothetical protein [uncultured Rhodopila sp.]
MRTVSGLGRGGTSLAATILFNAGIHMDHRLAEAVYDDPEFTEAFPRRQMRYVTPKILLSC